MNKGKAKRWRASCKMLPDYSWFCGYQLLNRFGKPFTESLRKGQANKPAGSKPGTDYLREEIRRRVAKGPVTFRLVLQIAEPGDRIDHPSIAWPNNNDRPTVELG